MKTIFLVQATNCNNHIRVVPIHLLSNIFTDKTVPYAKCGPFIGTSRRFVMRPVALATASTICCCSWARPQPVFTEIGKPPSPTAAFMSLQKQNMEININEWLAWKLTRVVAPKSVQFTNTIRQKYFSVTTLKELFDRVNVDDIPSFVQFHIGFSPVL